MAITQLPPLSLYVHIPWCVQKCPYCDFNSHKVKQEIPQTAYIDRLLFDLEQQMPQVWGRPLYSLFIGGGTPSLFEGEMIDRLLSGIRALLPFNSEMEVTMEANPGTVEAKKFKEFFQAGVNRLSIGVQSFSDPMLSTLGRIHNANEAKRAFEIARSAGFENINLDLMYALPNQTLKQAMIDLQTAIDLRPEHLSWYQLTLEPNTLFYQQPPSLPDDETVIDISDEGIQLLETSGFERYEVSAFSRNGDFASKHNLNYWHFGDYLGIGAGAHQKITRADTQQITRTSKRRNPRDYLDQAKPLVDTSAPISAQDIPFEFMLNVLRLKQGFEPNLFFDTTGLLLGQLEKVLQQAEQKGLLSRTPNRIQPTETGYQFLNDLLALFMPENFPELASDKKIQIKSIS